MLLHAQDAEGSGGMTDQQLRDEVITLFLAGHETTANALTWTWVLLGRHPEVDARLQPSSKRCSRAARPPPTTSPRLPYARSVVAETMRLYPPAWTMGRRVLRDYRWDGHDIPAGSLILMSQWVMHRDRRFWPDPGRFDPERWREPPAGRASPTSPSAPATGCASARASPGTRPSSSSPRSHSAGAWHSIQCTRSRRSP